MGNLNLHNVFIYETDDVTSATVRNTSEDPGINYLSIVRQKADLIKIHDMIRFFLY
jgi:hypothetical protein